MLRGGATPVVTEGRATRAMSAPEATALYGEESRNPHRSVPRATYVSLSLITVFYLFTPSWPGASPRTSPPTTTTPRSPAPGTRQTPHLRAGLRQRLTPDRDPAADRGPPPGDAARRDP